ncbi:tryptophan--tRNA ligase [Candidatus Micrarchaeota archaeon]|nr:tryptophan--tRNA ligase [Candidatus Micrarchaeota archaeon]MBI5176974.1 tryptophan--tRNA ligase [Candidatus Micrarchaeota archaeon]
MTQEKFVVTPWEVRGAVDYQALMRQFGTQHIDGQAAARISAKAGFEHFMLRRKIFFSHRDLGTWLDAAGGKKPVSLYTGRGPSGNTHIGHLLPWVFTKYLQDAFGCPLYFQMTDDEKFLFKEGLTLEETQSYAYENALDIIALGFRQGKTHIFLDTKYASRMYPLALEVAKRTTYSTAKAVFGFDDSFNIGQIFFTSMQSATALLPSALERERTGNPKAMVHTLIPCAIDQDPHFRVTRDVAEKIGYPKPSLVHAQFLPSLKGGEKMSASDPSSSIYTTDTPEEAGKKVMRAFTGGRPTVEEQRRLGGNPDICSVCNYLKFFFEPDDKKLHGRLAAYRNGDILDGENKAYLAEKVMAFLKEHQRKRESARKVVDKFILQD